MGNRMRAEKMVMRENVLIESYTLSFITSCKRGRGAGVARVHQVWAGVTPREYCARRQDRLRLDAWRRAVHGRALPCTWRGRASDSDARCCE